MRLLQHILLYTRASLTVLNQSINQSIIGAIISVLSMCVCGCVTHSMQCDHFKRTTALGRRKQPCRALLSSGRVCMKCDGMQCNTMRW
mmetsp:Transcript_4356/g.12536  ORF Transcript_4356/g.12536 Transcript_4356/m.12536 type:complete len:88 (-) Transcript_4356:487-750(-)